MSDETEPRTNAKPYTALVFTIGTGIMLAIVILAVGVVAAWNDTDATSGASSGEAALEGGERTIPSWTSASPPSLRQPIG